MQYIPHDPPPRTPDDLGPHDPRLDLFARVEGLVGEERALLALPAKDRSDAQHERLRSIGDELDRMWETLRERAERLTGRPAHG
jgi:hypothetical protein